MTLNAAAADQLNAILSTVLPHTTVDLTHQTSAVLVPPDEKMLTEYLDSVVVASPPPVPPLDRDAPVGGISLSRQLPTGTESSPVPPGLYGVIALAASNGRVVPILKNGTGQEWSAGIIAEISLSNEAIPEQCAEITNDSLSFSYPWEAGSWRFTLRFGVDTLLSPGERERNQQAALYAARAVGLSEAEINFRQALCGATGRTPFVAAPANREPERSPDGWPLWDQLLGVVEVFGELTTRNGEKVDNGAYAVLGGWPYYVKVRSPAGLETTLSAWLAPLSTPAIALRCCCLWRCCWFC